jgi:hypothetical protein
MRGCSTVIVLVRFAKSLDETIKNLRGLQDVQPRLCVGSMLVVSFGGVVLRADVRAEQPAAAQTHHWSAEKILPAEPGRKACRRRVYDAKHLAAHPQQKVTELTFFLRVSGYDAGGSYIFKNPDHIYYISPFR